MRTIRRFHAALARFGLALGLLAMLAAGPTAALAEGGDDAAPNRSPRTILLIGGVNVVLVANGDQLYAFVDQVEGNAPVENAKLVVKRTGSRQPVALTEESPGLFVAPFKRGGLLKDSFTVTLTSPDGSGEAAATLVYDDAPAPAPRSGNGGFGRLLAIALVSGAIGAMASVLAMRWWSRRRTPPLARTA